MEPANQEPFVLRTETLGAVPIVNHFLDRIGLDAIIDRFLPANDARLRLDPAVVIGVLVRNLTIDHQPIYALAEWAAGFDPALFGLTATDVDALNDDRTGRMLDRLFDTDRASLITHTVLSAVRHFDVNMDQLHNDSTTVTFSGGYHQATGAVRGDKPTPAITYGHNKDHRPDLKQLLCVLTVSADGAVPVAFRVEDGNTADDPTHIPTWDELVVLVGRPDFLYVADSKLCNRPAMDHINSHGGRFVTILPRTRKEDRQFRDRIATIPVEWTEAHHRPASRIGEPGQTFHTTPNPTGPSVDGYRIIWVRSSTKTDRDAESRRARIAKGIAAIDDLNQKLVSPKTRMKTLVAVQTAADAALKETGASRWIDYTITEHTTTKHKQEKRGRPGPNTRYRKIVATHHQIRFTVNEPRVAHDAASDGCFPLITNDTTLTDAEVLAAYRYQPNLERRNHILKDHQTVAPVYLQAAHRIEALLLCQFLALLTGAPHRTPHPQQHERPPTHQHCALPRTPALHRPISPTHPPNLRWCRPPPPHRHHHRHQPHHPNIPTRPHPPTDPDPRTPRHPHHHLHHLTRHHPGHAHRPVSEMQL
ncbi:MAG: IS1634 family transposase [Candidatus Microthrix sp.]|nr:IS1634 family transposase [Candidatus Microthrix sp.]MBK7019697.1 IS1634 family transposase [Candidatus Microthrix sp.]